MRKLLFILSACVAFNSYSQNPYFDEYEQDTLQLPLIGLRKIVALRTHDAVIGIDYNVFKKRLQIARKGTRKQIAQRARLKKRGGETDKIVAAQMKMYQKWLVALDSVNRRIVTNKLDTFFIHYQALGDGMHLGHFLAKLIESGQCFIFDTSMNRQLFIIRQKGWKKTGHMTASGSTLYFLKGSTRPFWSRWDFSS